MALISPFRGLRPRPELVDKIVAPPYDVINSQEARELAAGNDHSFIHVSKSEIDLDPEIDLHDPKVYAKARENLDRFLAAGWFERDEKPSLYLYRLSIGGHSQTGLVAGAAVAEYEKGLIKKHELTRADKELDRTVHTEALNIHTGPVFLAYRQRDEIDALVAAVQKRAADFDVTTYDGVRNELWVVSEPEAIVKAFAAVPCLYIADGHHRCASYCKVGAKKRDARAGNSGAEQFNFFLAVIFPHDQLRIMPYNRFVHDLNGHGRAEFLENLNRSFAVTEGGPATPESKHQFSMYFHGRWWTLGALPGTFDESDPIKHLDVSILQDNLLAPILGIHDPRRDTRIDFVGGIRGTGELEMLVNRRDAITPSVAFSLYPVTMDDLFLIADAGQIMPPKSTWFEPKLKDAFVLRKIDD